MALPAQPTTTARDQNGDPTTDDALIARYVELGPGYDTPDEALVGERVSLSALIMHLRGADGDPAASARAYRIPIEAMHAAIAYYRRHKAVVDARITLNIASATDYPDPGDDRDELIARFIETAPGTTTLDRVLVAGAVSLTALMRYLTDVGGDAAATARAFHIPIEAVQAARAYNARIQPIIAVDDRS